jgi:hypothetical protein
MAAKRSLPKNFFLFVLLAFVFWMLAKFSKEYEATVMFKVSYENFPENKILQKEPITQIPIHIKGTGFKLISAKLFNKEIKLNAGNLINFKGSQYYILLNQQELGIEKQLNSGLSIDYFVKDSVFFDLGSLATKKVPVVIDATVDFLPGYDFVNTLKATPDSVLISGPDGVLDEINKITTSTVVLNEVHSNVQQKVGLRIPHEKVKLPASVSEVEVSAEVDKFTEDVIEVPFVIENIPEGMIINTYPKTVKVSFKVGLADFNKVNANAFVIHSDYEFSSQNNLTYLILKLVSKPELVKNVKIIPSKVDFLIQK